MTEASGRHVPVLQKMEIADLLDAAIRLYRYNFTRFLEIVAVVQVALMVLYLATMWTFSQVLMAPSEEVPWAAVLGLGPLGLLYIAGWALLFPLGEAALAFAVSETYLGRQIGVWEAYRRMLPLVWRLLGTMILVGVLIYLGVMICLIPGILAWVWFSVTTPIVALEQTWGMGAMDRSYKLVSGHGWRVFITLALLQLIVLVATIAMGVLPILIIMLALGETNPLLAQSLAQAIGTATNIVVRPVAMIGVVLIYYDLRIRKEGFDLVTLTRALERSRGEGAGDEKPAASQPSDRELPPAPDTRVALPPRPNESESEQQPPT